MVPTDTRENEVPRGSKKIKEDEERRTTKVTKSRKVWFVVQTDVSITHNASAKDADQWVRSMEDGSEKERGELREDVPSRRIQQGGLGGGAAQASWSCPHGGSC